jgi:predicted RNA-binding protein (virulence factor B family)
MGTISSLTSSELVLSRSVKGKQEETTFKLESTTKKEGAIDKGAHVAVYYKDQNHERIATEVKAEPKKS